MAGTGPIGYFKYAAAFVRPDGLTTLLVQELEEGEAKRTGLDYIVAKKGYPDDLRRLLGRVGIVGVNFTSLPYGIGKELERRYELVDVSDELTSVRTQKNRQELADLGAACDITCKAALEIPKYVRPRMSELEVAARLEYNMKMLGSDGTAFETIVASGPNPADPHHKTGEREFKEGDLILLDFGAIKGGMHSDITRTFVLGKASDLQRELYSTILGIQKEALRNLKVGVDGYGLWENASTQVERFFRDRGMIGKMGHGLGHGIGYLIHDGPRLSKIHYNVPDGMIITVEPGGYSEGFGGVRIEDDVLVKNRGIEILTSKAPKDKLIRIPLR